MEKKIPLRPQNESFTNSQWQAIFDGNSNILVSASAGSGKTTVLVRRIIEKIRNGSQIDRLLVVTYTEAAAKEMKERIQIALQQAINSEPDLARRQHLLRQLSLLPMASISTLHAFCLTVIRRFYYLIEINPVFRLLTDETETLLLKEDVWEVVREKYYEKDQELFYQLTANFSNDRSDDGLTQLIFALYDFAKVNPDPIDWLEQLTTSYQIENDLGETFLYKKYLKQDILTKLTRVNQYYEECFRWLLELPEEEKLLKLKQLILKEQEQAKQLMNYLSSNQLEAAYQFSLTMGFDRYPSIRDEELKSIANQVKELRERNKKIIKELLIQLFALSPQEMKEVMKQTIPIVQKLSDVEKEFIKAYTEEKAKKNLVDFNDLEHFTLAILAKKTKKGWVPTEASDYYRDKFEEVLVDEYQDINRLQETILSWLKKPEETTGNLFMVGDVKQSIYSFRLADPTLFIEKYHQYGQNKDGKRIILAENFRSRKNILDFTNLIFQQLMDGSIGQIPYDQSAQLIAGAKQFLTAEDHQENQYDTELLIYEKKKELENEFEEKSSLGMSLQASEWVIEDKTEGELYVVALKIKELVGTNYIIYDKKLQTNRPVTYQDIVLLTPTKKNNLTILEVFKAVGIPIQVNDVQNYFQATEIRIMIALLQIIDNPYQDIPFVAVLRSPIVELTENELTIIRLVNKKGNYYEAFLQFNQITDSTFSVLQQKTKKFAEQLEKWREIAHKNQLAILLWTIYQDTSYLYYVGGMPAGKQRQANLYALVDRAAAYEKTSFRGLFQFIRFVEKMQEKNKDLAEPTILAEENAVHVMTIHASKGLEFPIVFVLDMTKEFNLGDLNERFIFDEQLGIGVRLLHEKNRILYDTYPFLAIRQRKLHKLLSEEMRKLYVALTRAEQKLFLVGSYNDQEALWKEWLKVADVDSVVLPIENRLQSKGNLMNWVGMALIRHRKMNEYQTEQPINKVSEIYDHQANFTLTFFTKNRIQEAFKQREMEQEKKEKKVLAKAASKEIVQKGLKKLNYQYPYEIAEHTTSYQSVSEIKRVFDDPNNQEIGKMEWQADNRMAPHTLIVNRAVEATLPQPKFIETMEQPSTAEVGIATHQLLQKMDLSETPSVEQLTVLLMELVETKVITLAVADRVNVNQIVEFYQTELGIEILTNYQNVHREKPFSMLIPADELIKDYPKNSMDDLLIHGIIDGYLEKEDSCLLYDYKTDHIYLNNEKEELQKIIKKYRGQLNLYKKALQQATNKPVKGIYLILLSIGKIIDMETEEIVEMTQPMKSN